MFGCENSNGRRNFQRAATCCDLQHRNSSNMTGRVRKVRCWLPIDRPHWEVMNITPDFFHHLKPWFGQDYLTAYGTMPSSIKEWIHRVTWKYFLMAGLKWKVKHLEATYLVDSRSQQKSPFFCTMLPCIDASMTWITSLSVEILQRRPPRFFRNCYVGGFITPMSLWFMTVITCN